MKRLTTAEVVSELVTVSEGYDAYMQLQQIMHKYRVECPFADDYVREFISTEGNVDPKIRDWLLRELGGN